VSAQREAAVRRVLTALVEAGPRPDAHVAALTRLRREWPTLYRALRDLADAHHVQLPEHTP